MTLSEDLFKKSSSCKPTTYLIFSSQHRSVLSADLRSATIAHATNEMPLLLHCRRTRNWVKGGLLLSAALLSFASLAYGQSALPSSSPDSIKDGSKDDSTRFG